MLFRSKVTLVVVPDYQLSLAIGKEGQNARLAAKLTGWKIDIKNETQAIAMNLIPQEQDGYYEEYDNYPEGEYEEYDEEYEYTEGEYEEYDEYDEGEYEEYEEDYEYEEEYVDPAYTDETVEEVGYTEDTVEGAAYTAGTDDYEDYPEDEYVEYHEDDNIIEEEVHHPTGTESNSCDRKKAKKTSKTKKAKT